MFTFHSHSRGLPHLCRVLREMDRELNTAYESPLSADQVMQRIDAARDLICAEFAKVRGDLEKLATPIDVPKQRFWKKAKSRIL